MPSFDELRRSLVDARKARADSSRALFLVGEQIARADARIESLARRARDAHGEERRALEDRKRRLEGARRERKDELDNVSRELASVLDRFHDGWTDPRAHAGQLTPNTPVLLFPVRLETRFKTVTVGEAQRRQLWVRVYPD